MRCRGGASPGVGAPRLAGTTTSCLRVRHAYYGEPYIESQQVFLPREYSLSATDLIPDDLGDEDTDVQWLEYCRCAATLDRQHVLECVLSDLDSDNSPIFELIDSAIQEPHEPGRPRENITVLARIGKAILELVAKAVDDQVNLRMACEVIRP
jgi:hypothetical protein